MSNNNNNNNNIKEIQTKKNLDSKINEKINYIIKDFPEKKLALKTDISEEITILEERLNNEKIDELEIEYNEKEENLIELKESNSLINLVCKKGNEELEKSFIEIKQKNDFVSVVNLKIDKNSPNVITLVMNSKSPKILTLNSILPENKSVTLNIIQSNSIILNNLKNNIGLCSNLEINHFYNAKSSDDIYITNIENKHISANSKSNYSLKGYSENEAKTITRGRIVIEKNAKKSVAHQTEKLLIDSQKGIKTNQTLIPILEVDNNDVECSHGSSIIPIDKKYTFYLESRGINVIEAKKIIKESFFSNSLKKSGQETDYRLKKILKEIL